MAIRSTQPLTEMSTRNLLGGKGKRAFKVNNLIVICGLALYKMWELQCLTPLQAIAFTYL
jgi:hypothetical protein